MLSNVHPHEDGSLIPTADDVMDLSRRTPELGYKLLYSL
jgi:hypothetical protein